MAKFLPVILAVLSTLCTSVRGALPGQNTLYYIRNVLTGWFFDVSFSSSAPGTPIIVHTMNNPRSGNQQWYVTRPVPGGYGFQASFPTVIIAAAANTPGFGVTVEPTGAIFALTELRGNSGLFTISLLNGTVTSPLTPDRQLTIESFNPSNPLASQLWEFVPA